VITRRDILKALAVFGVGGTSFGSYAFAESFRCSLTSYAVTPPRWPAGLNLRLAILADLHIVEPWMSLGRVASIVDQTNALGADAILLLGDYVVGHRLGRYSLAEVNPSDWAAELARLSAPLGVHAVLGNHDWWDEPSVQERRAGPTRSGLALSAAGVPVYENKSVRLQKDGQPFWLAGLGDQWAFGPKVQDYAAFVRHGKMAYTGVDDLPGTLAQVTDDAPVILMAHEPDIFPHVPQRVSLTLSGHTHGGQLRVFGYSPVVPSRFKNRYAYGHVVEESRNLIISGGLGCSAIPFRLGVPPEIVVVELGGNATA
jgi:predicted MPP superfamily phosphohydrolase